MRKLRKFTLKHFWQKFRESNIFTKVDLTKIISVREMFFKCFHTTVWKIDKFILTEKIFRQINLLFVLNHTYNINCFHRFHV